MQWRLYGEEAKNFLRALRPFLLLKKEEADLALKFPIFPRGKKLTEEVIAARAMIRQEIQTIRMAR